MIRTAFAFLTDEPDAPIYRVPETWNYQPWRLDRSEENERILHEAAAFRRQHGIED